MVTRIWHGATSASKKRRVPELMRTVAIPDYRSTPGNKGAYALRRIEGDLFASGFRGAERAPDNANCQPVEESLG
jgi:hypothetical protein